MAVRLVREASTTPNISNRDDACMVRYAYGGYDGIVENFGQQLSASISSGKVTINSGRIVLQGWEVDVETENISVPASTTGSVYEHLYLELNLLLEEARLLTVRSNAQSFPMGLGDDLTRNTSGTARLPLYRWSVSGSSISGLTRIAPLIPKLKTVAQNFDTVAQNLDSEIIDIKKRLDDLGFKEGRINIAPLPSEFYYASPSKNIVTVQGEYVIGALEYTEEFPKISVKNITFLSPVSVFVGSIATQQMTDFIRFLPKEEIPVGVKCYVVQDAGEYGISISGRIDTQGGVWIDLAGGLLASSWTITVYGIYFGYEVTQ